MVDQARRDLEGIDRLRGRDGGDSLGSLQRPPPDEDAQPPEEDLLGWSEQVVAPGDRVAQGLLSRRQVTRPPRQRRQAALQPRQQRRRRQELDARRGQLDRQRQPVQPADDLGDGLGILRRQGEARPQRLRARDEQGDGVVARQLGQRWQRHRIGHRQRLDLVLVLGLQAEPRPARGQHLQFRRRGQQIGHQRRRRQQVLEVVEQQQEALVAQMGRPASPLAVCPACSRTPSAVAVAEGTRAGSV